MLHQELEQAELGRTEMDRPAVALHTMRGEVDRDVVKGELALCRDRVAPPEQGAHPREQRVYAEWLGDVVVRAEIEPPHGVLIIGSRRDHNDGQVAAGGAPPNLPAHLDP